MNTSTPSATLKASSAPAASHKIIFDVAGIGTMSIALYRNGRARWYAGDSDEVIGFGPAQSARNLIASRSSS